MAPSRGSRWPMAATLLLLCLGAAGCASLPTPTAADMDRFRAEGSRVRLEDLRRGRKHYVAHCASCHSLRLPSRFTRAQWEKAMVKMQVKAKIDDTIRDSIMAYLSAYAGKEEFPAAR